MMRNGALLFTPHSEVSEAGKTLAGGGGMLRTTAGWTWHALQPCRIVVPARRGSATSLAGDANTDDVITGRRPLHSQREPN